jgi:hydroxymethylglutaryl-CoA lyase
MLLDLDVDEIDLGDTLGVARPEEIVRLLNEIGVLPSSHSGKSRLLTLHLHDTFGRAAECILAALETGLRSFDASVAGLGGCPYASTTERAAPGNIDTSLLVETIRSAGYSTEVDRAALSLATRQAQRVVEEARSRHAGGAAT